ncbi:Alanine--tRNA ligase, partial [Frankliniella fusca]
FATQKSEPNSQEVGLVSASQGSGSSNSPCLSPVVHREAASRALTKLGLSPLVTPSAIRSQGGKISSGKRKVEAATAVVRKKVCHALGLTSEDLVSPESQKAQDHDLLMAEVKEKVAHASNKNRKYQLLSLIPLSMSINEAAQQFGVSRTLISNSRKLKVEQGILPQVNFTRTPTVADSTKILIKEYYCREDNCKILPGTRDCVSVAKGIYEQKRLLLSNLRELHQAFKREYEDLKVGFSVFWALKPKWCVFAGAAGTHEQCICQIHQNFKLVLHALNIRGITGI